MLHMIIPFQANNITVGTSLTKLLQFPLAGLDRLISFQLSSASGSATLNNFVIVRQLHDAGSWLNYLGGSDFETATSKCIASALAYADGEINGFFADGPYVVPLVCNVNQPTVAYWAAIIAGVWLYGSRVSTSYIDYAGNRYLALRAAVYADMQLYKSGVKRLDAALRFPHATAPAAV